ncbi:probable ATP-dependent RNA helicase DDX20 isoform X2 [Clytia hemisphaerica]|uniref:probable ATP-dependent RNA helicase DDX20 isoform X2 n=1 Tax=Clytia hemisphaerica TaxID=252671 RepID=UPI0034D3EC37
MIAHDLTTDTERTLDVQPSQKNTDFESFLPSPNVLKGLKECGFHRPSPIQVESIPLAKCGIDLVCQAKSGTGKTCVLGVCCLETVETKLNKVQALVLAPTREIAHQIHGVITHIGCFMDNLKCGLFIGGIRMDKDVEMLKNCHIAIGTPGRIKHLMENKMLSPTSIRLFIMDEADKLLEKGSFEEQINWIYSALPKEKQMLALSATYPEVLAQHLNNYMTNPIHVRINPKDVALTGVVQFKRLVKHHTLPNKLFEEKYKVLIEILKKLTFQQCMVFSNYHSRAEHLSRTLIKEGWPSTHIAGSQMQSDRLKAIDKLKTFQCRILITTDLTARGIDCDKVNLVINLDIPWNAETYLHRVGRAGRFGSQGIAISLVSSSGEEKDRLEEIARSISRELTPLPEKYLKESTDRV